jgi:hypothetical protein
MTLMSATGMSAAVEAASIVAGAEGFSVRGISRRWKEHLPKHEGYNAGEHQQQRSKMHPTGRGHLDLLPHSGCQFDTTKWM